MTNSNSFLPHYLFLITACTTLFLSCKKDGNSNPLDGCCDTPAINATVGTGHVYVPNVFTPNGDGINDYLPIYGDQNIMLIRSLRITDKEGTTVFHAENGSPNDSANSWDGTIDYKYKLGVYSIEMVVEAFDGTIATLRGKVCNYHCVDSEEEEPISGVGCQFPTQVDNGVFNPNIPSGETSGCFE